MSDTEPLPKDIDALCEVFRGAETPRAAFRIGLEAEKFGLTKDGRSLRYDGAEGVEGLFQALSSRGFEAVRESDGGPVVALKRGLQTITLEPAAQFELSGSPRASVTEVATELFAHLDELSEVWGTHDLYWLHLGFHPLANEASLPWVPKQRYPIMRDFLPTKGKRGLDMMRRTATVQFNLDFESEADAMLRLVTLLKLTPVLQAMTLNAPFIEGKQSALLSERLDVWLNMDPARSGLIAPLWNAQTPRYEDYARWALGAGMFLFKRGPELHRNTGQTFDDFWRNGYQGERATMGDWKLHLGTLFPEVRLKTTLEVRGVDSLPPGDTIAVAAFLTGLSYDRVSLDRARELLAPLDYDQAVDLQRRVRTEGLRANVMGTTVSELARQLLELAKNGLLRRAKTAFGIDESPLLKPLERTLELNETPAERIRSAFAASQDNSKSGGLEAFLWEWAREANQKPDHLR